MAAERMVAMGFALFGLRYPVRNRGSAHRDRILSHSSLRRKAFRWNRSPYLPHRRGYLRTCSLSGSHQTASDPYQLHGTVVYQHMFQCHIRIVLCHFLHNSSPESGRIQYVSLIHAGNFFPTLSGNIKAFDGNPADLVLIVGQGINSFSHSVFFDSLSLRNKDRRSALS